MGADGNLVLYEGGGSDGCNAVWATNSGGRGIQNPKFIVQNDLHMMIYGSNDKSFEVAFPSNKGLTHPYKMEL
jgi:hypothetical protein